MTLRRVLRALALTGATMLGLVILFAALCTAILGTNVGRQGLLTLITAVTASPDFRLEMDGLDIDDGLRLRHLGIADASGVWIEVEEARLAPDYGALTRRRVALDLVRVGRIVLRRLPETREEDTDSGSMPPALRIARLDLEHIHLHAEVLGQEAHLRAHGAMRLEPGESTVEGEVLREDRDDSLTIAVRLTDDTAELDLRLLEKPEGLLHALLGLAGASGITVRVAGTGPREAWPATISAQVADLVTVTGNATVALTETPEVAFNGCIGLGPDLLRHAPAMPDANIDLNGLARWRDGILSIPRLELRNDAADMNGNGTWTTEDLMLTAQATPKNLTWLLPEGIRPGPGGVNATLRLGSRATIIETTVRIQDWWVNGQPVSGHLDATTTLPSGFRSWQTRAAVRAALPGLEPALAQIEANATLSGNATAIRLDTLRLVSPGLDLALSGTMDENLRLDARADLVDFPIHGSPPLRARLETRLDGRLDLNGPSFAGTLTATAARMSGLPARVAWFLGPQAKFDADVDVSPRRVQVHSARLTAGSTASATGEFQAETQAFSAKLTASTPDLNQDGLGLRGLDLEGAVNGTLEKFSSTLIARAKQITTSVARLDAVTLHATVENLPAQPRIELRAQGLAAGEAMELRGRAAWQQNRLVIADSTLTLPATTAQLSGELRPESMLFIGATAVDSRDLRALGRVAGIDLRGNATVSADLDPDGSDQRIRFQGHGAGLDLVGLNIAELNLRGALTVNHTEKTILDVDARHLALGAIQADRITAKIVGAKDGVTGLVTLDHAKTATALTARSRMTRADQSQRLVVEDVGGRVLGQAVRLRQPLEVDAAPDHLRWNETTLMFGPASIRTRGVIARESLALLDIHDLDLASLTRIIPELPAGRLNARLDLAGARANPNLDLTLNIADLHTQAGNLDLPRLAAQARASLRAGQFTATAEITDPDSEMRAVGEMSCPLGLDLDIPAVTISESTPVSGKIIANANLKVLPHFLRLDDQSMNGTAEMQFLVGGTPSAPTLTGSARVRNASYENHRTGTRLTKLQGSVQAHDSTLTAAFSGADGHTGHVEAQGTLNVAELTYAADITLRAARLLDLDSLKSTVNGTVHARGDEGSAHLGGNLTLDPSEFRLPRSMPADLPRIDITHINTPPSQSTPRPASRPFSTDLDLNIHVPARFFVTGRGLDSEWSGRVRIQGSPTQPRVTGTVNLLRGRFDFLDRSFDLTRGTLSLDGTAPPNPYLDVIGETQVLETMAQVHLLGPVKNFRLTLSSVPALPADEILALILFGRSSRQISPLQAVRLAQAASELTGIGAPPDFLGSIKTRLGLQEVNVDKDEDDATNVGIGGYLGGKYYVRTQRSVSGQDKTKVEIQITPKISVETEIGADSRQGGGVTWKHDY